MHDANAVGDSVAMVRVGLVVLGFIAGVFVGIPLRNEEGCASVGNKE